MTLQAGTRLGPYEIQELVGAGGMGEVYRARDTRLERTVAVKVLPTHLSSSPEVRERFDREAKTISQLSHPNVCALYDVGHQDGIDYLVMEYLEGETLAERLLKGPLAIEQVLRYGGEIAGGLDRAHRQGIVHRDLKPGNVMLTRTGVKLLDFGLAKAFQAQPLSGVTALPTAAHLTQEGTILGTFQYMAPEQLEGKDADSRTDIFALGAVLFEMATGRKAFGGASQASLISSIMSADPPSISAVQPLSPPALDRVIRKCLAKDPEDRWQSAHDVAGELKWVGEGGSQAGIPAPVVSRRLSRERLAWGIAGILAAAALVAGAVVLRGAKPREERREFILMPGGQDFETMAVAPDERRVAVIIEEAGGATALYLRPIGSIALERFAGTEGAVDPFWSPDGRHIGFFSRGKLKQMSVEGGAPQTLADADRFGGAWSADGTILFTTAFGRPLVRIPATGGTPEPVTTLDASRQEVSHYWPTFLPDGDHFVFYVRTADPDKSAIWVGSIRSKERKLVTLADAGPLYVEPGYLLFAREGALLAQRFDPASRTLSGSPLTLARKVASDPASNTLWAAAGRSLLVYEVYGPRNRQLTWMDREGRVLGTLGKPAEYWSFTFSPDEKRMAVTLADPERRAGDVWLLDTARGTRNRLTSGTTDEFNARFSPDGYVYYTSDREGFYNLYRRPASGGGNEETVLKNGFDKWLDDLSRDGEELLYSSYDLKTGYDVWTLATRPNAQPQVFSQTPVHEGAGRFSPDGRWVVFVSRESGREEVFLAPRASPAERQQVSVDGGNDPRWSRDGAEVFFVASNRTLMTSSIRLTGDSAEPGPPKALFRNEGFRWQWGNRNQSAYEVAADGRFLVSVPAEEPGARPIVAVLDWTAGLPK